MSTPTPYVAAHTPRKAALAYHAAGFDPLRLVSGRKSPPSGGHPPERLADADAVQEAFEERSNVAVRLGALGLAGHDAGAGGTSRLVDVDLDWPEAAALASRFLPGTGFRFGRGGSPDSHYLYVVAGRDAVAAAAAAFTIPDGCDLPGDGHANPLELRALANNACYVRVPPSTHAEDADGTRCNPQRVAFREGADGVPAEVDAAALWADARDLALAAVLARVWPRKQGTRHFLALAVAGVLRRAGLDVERVVRIVRAAAEHAGDDELADRERCVRDTAATLDADDPTSGFPTLAGKLGPGVVGLLYGWASRDVTGGGGRPRFTQEWQDVQEPQDVQELSGQAGFTIPFPLAAEPPMLDAGAATPRRDMLNAAVKQGRPSPLPPGEHIAACVERVVRGDSAAEGLKEDALFDFVRHLKACPAIVGLEPAAVLAAVDEAFDAWGWGDDGWTRAFPGFGLDAIGRLPWLSAHVRLPAGRNALQSATRLADRHPLVVPAAGDPAAVPLRCDARFRRLMSVMAWLEWLRPGEMFIGCEDAGKVMGVSGPAAATKLKSACSLGLLKLLAKGRFRGKGGKPEASNYQFLRPDLMPADPHAAAREVWREDDPPAASPVSDTPALAA